MEGLGISLGYLLVQLFNFAIMFVVINAWVVKPIIKMLDKRRETIAQGLEDARVAAEARANAEREAAKIVNEAQQNAATVMREASDRAEKVELEIRSEAEAEVVRQRQASLEEIEQERDVMLANLRNQVVSISMAAAQKLIGESMDEKRQRILLEEFFAGVQNGKLVVLKDQALSGESAEVTTALPLSKDEQKMVASNLQGTLRDGAEVKFRVDPSILGGLVLRVDDRVVDGSVAGKLQSLRQSLS
ncbi:MAG: F0F1 ATP synthase subunit B [Anaerolineaceae bacterium]|nr:F0F1 ATP synthase subunit B [Anaerolineaceae bacterium]